MAAALLIGLTFASQGWKAGLLALAVYLVYQQVENEVLHPLVQRKTIRMNPLLISVALLLGTAWAGIMGTILALPGAGALQVVARDALERRRRRHPAESQRAPEAPQGEPPTSLHGWPPARGILRTDGPAVPRTG